MGIDKRVELIGIAHAMLEHGHAIGFVFDVLGEALRCEGMADLMILWTDTAAGAVDRAFIIQDMRQHLGEAEAFRAGTFETGIQIITKDGRSNLERQVEAAVNLFKMAVGELEKSRAAKADDDLLRPGLLPVDRRARLIGIAHSIIGWGGLHDETACALLAEAWSSDGMADLLELWSDADPGIDRDEIWREIRQHLDESKAFRAGTFDPVVAVIKENESGLGLLDDAMREARDLDDDNQKPVVPVAMIHSEVTLGSVEQFIEGYIRKGTQIRERGPATVYVLLRALADAHEEGRKPFASRRYTALAERLWSTGMVQ